MAQSIIVSAVTGGKDGRKQSCSPRISQEKREGEAGVPETLSRVDSRDLSLSARPHLLKLSNFHCAATKPSRWLLEILRIYIKMEYIDH